MGTLRRKRGFRYGVLPSIDNESAGGPVPSIPPLAEPSDKIGTPRALQVFRSDRTCPRSRPRDLGGNEVPPAVGQSCAIACESTVESFD